MITVLVADDHPIVRNGLRAVCAGAPDIDIVAEAVDGRDAVDKAAHHQPDVVLLDLEMPELHGTEATRRIITRAPHTAVLVLTMFDDDETIFAAISAGAAGYLLKGANGDDILAAVRAAATGHAVLDPSLASRLRGWLERSSPDRHDPFPELTGREREILGQIAEGHTNSEIASRLHLSTKTVANNVSTILNKLHLVDRSQAIVRAREAGLGVTSRPGQEPAQ